MAERTAEPKPDLKEIKNKLQGMMKSPAMMSRDERDRTLAAALYMLLQVHLG